MRKAKGIIKPQSTINSTLSANNLNTAGNSIQQNNENFSHKYINATWLTGTGIVALIFLILKMYVLHPYPGDEAIYIFQGKLLAEGNVPYRDFAMAHPPIQALFTGILIKLFGYHFTAFRMIPIVWTLLAGILLSIMVRKELGATAAIFATALYILAYEPLRASSHFTGINMTIAILMGAFLAQRTRYYILCAVLCILAIYTRLYALPAVFALLMFTFLENKTKGFQLLKFEIGIGFALFLIFGLWSGFGNMINDIFLFQAQKTKMNLDQIQEMRDGVFFHNAIPFVLFILGMITFASKYYRGKQDKSELKKKVLKNLTYKDEDTSLIRLSILTVLVLLGILLNLNRVWMYYYVLAFPFAAITGGWMISYWLHNIYNWVYHSKINRISFNSSHTIWLLGSLLIFLLAWGFSPRLEKRLAYYKEYIVKPIEQRKSNYKWIDGNLPEFINTAVRNLYWKDERIIGETYSEITYYLWHVSRVYDIIDELQNEITSRTTPKDNIFGDSGTVPLLALLSKRNIAANEIDTNLERYRSGNADPNDLIKSIDLPSTKLILLRDKFGVASLSQIQILVNTKYKMVKEIRSSTGILLRLYERQAS